LSFFLGGGIMFVRLVVPGFCGRGGNLGGLLRRWGVRGWRCKGMLVYYLGVWWCSEKFMGMRKV
jgi:hypothetical protein